MGLERDFEDLVRRAVCDGIADSEERLRAVVRDALAEQKVPRERGDDLVDTKTAAQLVRVQPRTINSWKRRGLIRVAGRGKQDLYRLSDVLAAAERRNPRRTIVDMQAAAAEILRRKGGGKEE